MLVCRGLPQSFTVKNLPAINTLTIYNQVGQLAAQFVNQAVVDIQHLPAGIYLVHIVTEQKSETKKLEIRR